MGRFQFLHAGFSKVKSLILIFTGGILCCLGAAGCSSDNSTSSQSGIAGASKEFLYNYEPLYFYYNNAKEYLREPQAYIGKVRDGALADYEIPWDYYDLYYMYESMFDPFTQYVDPSRAAVVLASLMESEQKLDPGFERDSKYVVTKVIENSPAEKAGLKVGDQITAIENVAPTSDAVFNRLSIGDENEVITYTVKRDSMEIIIPVILKPYYTPTVELSFRDSIPIIKIEEFTAQTSNDSGTYGEFVKYLRQTANYKATIIDLRNNGGGDGDQCFAMSQEFLSKGDSAAGVISTVADTIRYRQTYDTTFAVNEVDGIAKDRYFVFLANEGSASCSEVLLLSVTMNRKLPIVGATTYGKGIGQASFMTPSFSLAIITGLKIIDKNFGTYHKYGIAPDFPISDSEMAMRKAIELAKEATYLRTAGYGTVNTGHFAKMGVEQDTMPGFFMPPKEIKKSF
jgi:C-terminal peptidase prc